MYDVNPGNGILSRAVTGVVLVTELLPVSLF